MIGSVRDRETFRLLRESSARGRSGPVRVAFLRHDEPVQLVAFAISRRFGNAVDRNRARRRMKAVLRTEITSLPNGSYLFSCQRSVLSASFADLTSSMQRSIEKATVYKAALC